MAFWPTIFGRVIGAPARVARGSTSTSSGKAVARIEAEGGAYPQALAYDKKAGVLYGQNHSHELLTFNTNGLVQKSYDLVRNGTTLDLLVHPEGHKVVILAHPNIFVVNLPVE